MLRAIVYMHETFDTAIENENFFLRNSERGKMELITNDQFSITNRLIT